MGRHCRGTLQGYTEGGERLHTQDGLRKSLESHLKVILYSIILMKWSLFTPPFDLNLFPDFSMYFGPEKVPKKLCTSEQNYSIPPRA